jgi:hypothetical protein
MKSEGWMGAAGALVVAMAVTGAQAGPTARAPTDLKAAAAEFSPVETTAYRRCRWRDNRGHCTRYGGRRVHGNRDWESDYYEHDVNTLPYGSQRWWDQMLRENRAGNPGGARN